MALLVLGVSYAASISLAVFLHRTSANVPLAKPIDLWLARALGWIVGSAFGPWVWTASASPHLEHALLSTSLRIILCVDVGLALLLSVARGAERPPGRPFAAST